jgi:transposase-like protein
VDPNPPIAVREHNRGRKPIDPSLRKKASERPRKSDRPVFDESYLKQPEYQLLSQAKLSFLTPDEFKVVRERARPFIIDVMWGHLGEGVLPCPKCGVIEAHRWMPSHKSYRCGSCRHEFTLKSGTIFHNMAISVYTILHLLARFVESKDACSSREHGGLLGISPQGARVLTTKIRERLKKSMLAEGPLTGFIQADAAYYMKYVRPGNVGTGASAKAREERMNAGLKENGKTSAAVSPRIHALVVFVQEGPWKKRRYRVAVVKTENQVDMLTLAKTFCDKGAYLIADQHSSYNVLHGHFKSVSRVNHGKEFTNEVDDDTNLAEMFHSRMRAGEKGAFHRFTLKYLEFHGWEFAWRQQMVGWDNLYQFNDLIRRVFARDRSEVMADYWNSRKVKKNGAEDQEDDGLAFAASVPKDQVPKKMGRPPKDATRPQVPEELKKPKTSRKTTAATQAPPAEKANATPLKAVTQPQVPEAKIGDNAKRLLAHLKQPA